MAGAKRRVVFMGSSRFAETILRKLAGNYAFELAAVCTRPDAKSGRGLKSGFGEVKKLALELGAPLLQPSGLKQPEEVEKLARLEPDFLVVASYGLLLPQPVLDLPSLAPLNVHASLLPLYRGAAPIQRAIMDGRPETGVSIMRLVKELDAGPVYAARSIPVAGLDHPSLESALAGAGADLLLDVMSAIADSGLEPVEQDHSKATYAAKLEKKDGIIDWRRPAAETEALIRGVQPWPGAQMTLEFEGSPVNLAVIRATLTGERAREPGAVRLNKKRLEVACGDEWLELVEVKPEGRRLMKGADFANGFMRVREGPCGRALMA